MADLLKGYSSDEDNDDGKDESVVIKQKAVSTVPRSFLVKADRLEKRRRVVNSDPLSSDFSGPWGGFEGDKLSILNTEDMGSGTKATEHSRDRGDISQRLPEAAKSCPEQLCVLHETNSSSWMEPRASGIADNRCHLPKKQVHIWRGHSGGVQRIKLFPGYGHLLLSCSLDGTVKIWDCLSDKKCKQTYTGHSQAVRDIQFTHGGRRFYSAGFDTLVRLWDTETGQVISTLSDSTLAFCLAVHPDNFDSVVVGTQSKKAVQFDSGSGRIVQQYAGHQGSVSSVSFVEDGRKLITSSDDRKVFTWVYGIPVIDRYIAEPTMHSIPAVAIHPSNKFLVGQSMNNTILVYQAGGEFKYQSNRKFVGHANAGYAIQPAFSRDGKFVMSGSSDGSLHFWDWKTSNLYRSIKAHDRVCMDSVWHPLYPSKVFSCGWDGLIKMWE